MEGILFILDRGHGSDTNGKSSPDGSFKEWEYSQKTINELKRGLDDLGISWAETVTTDKDVFLTERVRIANELSKDVKHPILLSLHNNAGGGTGNELFVKREPTQEIKDIANLFCKQMIEDFPEIRWRRSVPNIDYKEANFTIIGGNLKIKPEYIGLLPEFLFMDNENDLKLLKDEKVFNRYVSCLLSACLRVCNYYKLTNFIV